jgi:FtsH-binding integral membrane protein
MPNIPLQPVRDVADQGLHDFITIVYVKLTLGLVLAGAMAWAAASWPPLTNLLFVFDPSGAVAGFTLLGTVLAWSPLVMLLGASLFMRRNSATGAGVLYVMVVAAIGASLGVLFLAYAAASIVSSLLVTAGAFAAVSLWGLTVKRDLSGFGRFLTMALVGLILAMIVNLFLKSGPAYFALNCASVLIFCGLTAWDNQRLKQIYYTAVDNDETFNASSNLGALSLFINFINLFESILALGGSRPRR